VVDVVDKETRSRMMAGIRGKNTKSELLLRRTLHAAGFRYRIHDRRLPGKPDLVFPMYRAVIFVHGCYWHRHPGCWWNTTPSSNIRFWQRKLDRNAERDAHIIVKLGELGWRVAVVWECSFRLAATTEVAEAVGGWLRSEEGSLNLPLEPRKRTLPPS
jgi:DNA mismatch endonuclease (patch repair protein)